MEVQPGPNRKVDAQPTTPSNPSHDHGTLSNWRCAIFQGRPFLRYGWSLERSIWSHVPADLVKGRQWRWVQFAVAEANSVPTVAGVYVVCACPPGRHRSTSALPNDLFSLLYTAIYVGRTNNLRTRFTQHCQNPKPEIRLSRECFSDSLEFWFHRLDPGILIETEACLIECFGPPANAVRGAITARMRDPMPASSGL